MLVDIVIPSIYKNGPLPRALARCASDTRVAILAVARALNLRGGNLRLSDLFRGRDLQQRAHTDWLAGRKRAYSPPPGASMHEAGRAMDIDLGAIGVDLGSFWTIAAAHGFTPVIDTPDSRLPEAWHFDHRGSHQLVYDYVKSGKAGPKQSPYKQMAVSAILAAGIPIDGVNDPEIGAIQSGLIRLGEDPGPIDGVLGSRTRSALARFGFVLQNARNSVEARLRARWPQEYPHD
jgi:hypothetical protein